MLRIQFCNSIHQNADTCPLNCIVLYYPLWVSNWLMVSILVRRGKPKWILGTWANSSTCEHILIHKNQNMQCPPKMEHGYIFCGMIIFYYSSECFVFWLLISFHAIHIMKLLSRHKKDMSIFRFQLSFFIKLDCIPYF